MTSRMNQNVDPLVVQTIQKLRKKAAQSCKLGVDVTRTEFRIGYEFPGEEDPCTDIIFNVQEDEPEYEEVIPAIGEILAQGYAQLQHFRLSWLTFERNSYPQFWRGLAANQVLKEVCFIDVPIPNEPDVFRFLTNPALELLDMSNCHFSHGTVHSFFQGIQSSHIKKLKIDATHRAAGVSWSLLWRALEHGATCLECLQIGYSTINIHGIENGFESFLANNTTIQSIHLCNMMRGRDDLPLFVALGRGLAVNTTVKILDLCFPYFLGNPAIGEPLIQTVFAEGLHQNMAVESLKVEMKVCPETVNALADGLERMMRNRANAATHDGHDQQDSLPILKELVFYPGGNSVGDVSTPDALREIFFDRLSQSDVILVETVAFDLQRRVPSLSSKVYDFIRSTKVTKSLLLYRVCDLSPDNKLANLADAMEANHSIAELEVQDVQFHKMTNLLFQPNTYRIRCQCRRNEIQVHTLRKPENLSLLPLVLAKLLPSGDRPADDEERQKMEAHQLVDRTIAFELLKDIPALFAVCGKRKRED